MESKSFTHLEMHQRALSKSRAELAKKDLSLYFRQD